MSPVGTLVVASHIASVIFAYGLSAALSEQCDHVDTIFVSNRLWLILLCDIGLLYCSLMLISIALRSHPISPHAMLGTTTSLGLSLLAWMVVGLVMIIDKHRDGCVVSYNTAFSTYLSLFMMPVITLMCIIVFRAGWDGVDGSHARNDQYVRANARA